MEERQEEKLRGQRRKEEERKLQAALGSLFGKGGKLQPPHFLSSSFWQVERGKEGERGRQAEVCVALNASSSG